MCTVLLLHSVYSQGDRCAMRYTQWTDRVTDVQCATLSEQTGWQMCNVLHSVNRQGDICAMRYTQWTDRVTDVQCATLSEQTGWHIIYVQCATLNEQTGWQMCNALLNEHSGWRFSVSYTVKNVNECSPSPSGNPGMSLTKLFLAGNASALGAFFSDQEQKILGILKFEYSSIPGQER